MITRSSQSINEQPSHKLAWVLATVTEVTIQNLSPIYRIAEITINTVEVFKLRLFSLVLVTVVYAQVTQLTLLWKLLWALKA